MLKGTLPDNTASFIVVRNTPGRLPPGTDRARDHGEKHVEVIMYGTRQIEVVMSISDLLPQPFDYISQKISSSGKGAIISKGTFFTG